VIALGASLLFLVLGFAGIYVIAKVADVKDGTVLAAVLIVPAVLYLLLSGRVSDLRGPGGLEVRLTHAASQAIPLSHGERGSSAVAFEKVREVHEGRKQSFLAKVKDIAPEDPVVLTLTLGSGPIDGVAAADYAKGLTQFPRFRFVAILDEHDRLVAYMPATAFRHMIESDVFDAQALLNNIEQKNVTGLLTFPSMFVATATSRSSVAEALREMDQAGLPALLVTDRGKITGIVERDQLANKLLLSLIERPGAQA
jgi:CBS domain-containing protein